MFEDFDFAVAYLDDILIQSVSKEHVGHRKTYGFKHSEEKCKLFLTKIKYLVQIIDKNGRRPDMLRASAIKNMPPPRNMTTLQTFLGLTNYYEIYVHNIHNLRSLLNDLRKNE